MYYDNKFKFYIKEYSTQIVVGIVCFIIVSCGLFVHFKISNNQANSTVTATAVENSVEADTQTSVTEDDSMLPEEMRVLKAGETVTVKVADVNNEDGSILIVYNNQRIKAKLIGVDFSEMMPDTYLSMSQEIVGNFVDLAFDEAKVENGYAMVYVYPQNGVLYNAELLKEGKTILDSNVSKKALEYNTLAESQAYAKQTLAGVWEQ